MPGKTSLKVIIPVFVSFYVMGFVDIVGMATGYVKDDYRLSESLAQLLPFMVFLWFALLSIPTGIFQDRKGKKRTVNIGMVITGVGVLVPFIHYTYPTALIGFVILGIGNTILQVSANPLLLDISSRDSQAANLSLSQFIKSTASMLGPIITGMLVGATGNWRLIFPVYAGLSFLSVIWLSSIKVEETKTDKPPATFRSVLVLFRKPFVVIMILSTFLMVGFDVGMNSNIANFLRTKFGISLESASLGISIYFASLMAGRFTGAILLRKISSHGFLVFSVILTFLGLAGLLLSGNITLSRIMIFVAGLGFSNTFPIIFAMIVGRMPEYSNELSSLIILSVIGGAVIPPVMGLLSDYAGVTASMSVLVVCMIYVGFASLYAIRATRQKSDRP
jgi:FHS family L-fucose permease-like MFS transporter